MTPIYVSVVFLGLMIAIRGTHPIVIKPIVTCDTDFSDLTYSITPVICPKDCWRQHPRNRLCGFEKYSGGSICLAAMQLGLVDHVGGFVTVYKNMNVLFKPVGGFRYAVTSHNCSRSKVSYTFDITCDTNGNAMYALNEAWCPPKCGSGLLLGSDPYHVNSSVCSAAVHAGKVTKELGGEVKFYKLHDVRSNFTGLMRNGVKSVGSLRSSVKIFTFELFNECKLPTKLCQNNATCNDLQYGFVCICTPGFKGKLCDRDIDECGLAGSCHANAACNNTKGSFYCTCNAGYSGDGKNCVRFYCDSAPTVSNGGSVTPTLPASPGYHGNTVVTASCANGFVSTSGSKTSECSATNTWRPTSFECTDIDECGLAGSCHANAACNNTKGSFYCTCNAGYSGDGKNCVRFYCDSAPTVSNGGSVTPTFPASPGYHGNTVVTASCANGFVSNFGIKTAECIATNTWTPATLECSDINECGLAGSCHPNAACNNTKGSFTCTCNAGYMGDGKNCVPFYCDSAPTVSIGGSVTPNLPASPGYHGNTVVTASCPSGSVSPYGIKTAECSATNIWTPATLSCLGIESCYAGVKDGRVKDSQMTASSIYESRFPPNRARLDGATWWQASNDDTNMWLQVDFLANKTIYGVVTQAGKHWGWVAKFEIKYSDDGTNFRSIEEGSTAKLFSGNADHYSKKINRFPSVTGRYFRLVVRGYQSRPAFRLEYMLC